MTSFDQDELINKCIRQPIEFDAKRALSEILSIPLVMFDSSSRGPTHQDIQGIFIRVIHPVLPNPIIIENIIVTPYNLAL